MPELTFLPSLLLAAFVHGAFGFGFPLVATPLLALQTDLRTAVLLTLIPTVAINLFSILGERHWREALRTYWPIPAFTVVGSLAGTQLLLSVDPEPFRLLLALVLVAYLVSHRFHQAEREHPVPKWGMALFGVSLGLLAGVVNVFAPLIIVYSLYTRMPTHLMVATFNMSFLVSKGGQIGGFVLHGSFDPQVVKLTLVLLPLALLGLWLGIRIRRRIAVEAYRRLLRIALWVIAVLLVGDWARRL